MKHIGRAGEVAIDPATEADVGTLLDLIRQLAAYEKLDHLVSATEADLRAALFGPKPVAQAVIARVAGAPVGFALFFESFSTFLGKPGLWLEDLFVVPHARGRGIGAALFAHVGGLARQRGCGRFEWAALDWNLPAIDFYRRFGALPMQDWTTFRIAGEALRAFPGDRSGPR